MTEILWRENEKVLQMGFNKSDMKKIIKVSRKFKETFSGLLKSQVVFRLK